MEEEEEEMLLLKAHPRKPLSAKGTQWGLLPFLSSSSSSTEFYVPQRGLAASPECDDDLSVGDGDSMHEDSITDLELCLEIEAIEARPKSKFSRRWFDID